MEFTVSEWQGYECLEFLFEGYNAYLVKPKCEPNGKWALKTEYRGAFPATECELLSRGWHVAFRTNKNRFAFFRRVDVYFGKPIRFEELNCTSATTEEYTWVTNIVFDHVCRLYDLAVAEENARVEK